MKKSLKFVFIACLSLFSFLQSQAQPGEIKNHLNTTIVTFDSYGVARDFNNDTIFAINQTTGVIKDINDATIGRISGNQVLDWSDALLYSIDGEDDIVDVNSDEVGSVNSGSSEIIKLPSFTLGSYVDIPAIYAVYYFFVYAAF